MCSYDELINNFEKFDDSIWAYPKNSPKYDLPVMGFKIHISAIESNVKEIFSCIQTILQENLLSYKVVSSSENLIALNSGDFGYSQIGKVITIYPRNNEEFSRIIEHLYRATLGFQSIDVPSDFRYKNSFVVFYRYGELAEVASNGEYKDKRLKQIPSNICVPLDDFYIKRFENFPKNYIALTCLRTRGKSRIFYGIDTNKKVPIIIKEGLMLGEIDSNGIDGANNAMMEKDILLSLSNNKYFPKLIDYFYKCTSFIIVEEYLKGRTLKQLIIDDMMCFSKSDIKDILSKIIDILISLDTAKIMVGDLSFDNVLLGDSEKIYFIDVEFYQLYDQINRNVPGTAGFWCRDYSGKQATIYAFFAIWYYLVNPKEYSILLSAKEISNESNLYKFQDVCAEVKEIINMPNYSLMLKRIKNILEEE